MKRAFNVLLLLLLAAAILLPGVSSAEGPYKVLGSGSSYKDSTSGVSVFPTVTGTYQEAFVQVEGGDVRWTVGSSNPTANDGFLIYDGGSLTLTNPYDISGFKWTLNDVETGVTLWYTIYGK
jgi:hypothetical protein